VRGMRMAEVTSAVHGELYRFVRTLQAPPGESAATFLKRYGGQFNTGGPAAPVRRGCEIGDLSGWRLSADVYLPSTSSSGPLHDPSLADFVIT
jgi:hypothetical protein